MKQEEQIGSSPAVNEDEIIRYLLDDLGDEKRSLMEERLAREPAFFDQVAAVEDDLILRYLRHDLEQPMSARFSEVYTSSPAKRARVESARVWQQAVKDEQRSRRRALAHRRWPVAAMLAGAAAVLCFLLMRPIWNHPGRKPDKPTQPIVSGLTVVLEPGLTRSGGGTQITVPASTTMVRLQLEVINPGAHRKYYVTLGTVERPLVWQGSAVSADSGLGAEVPADKLIPGDYTLELESDGQELATYYFRVKAK